MTSHGVAPPGLFAGKPTYPWGWRPRLFDVVPPGLKKRNFKKRERRRNGTRNFLADASGYDSPATRRLIAGAGASDKLPHERLVSRRKIVVAQFLTGDPTKRFGGLLTGIDGHRGKKVQS